MRRALAALPLVALVAAALDTLLVRLRLPHRGADPALFLQACLLWLALALLALLPSYWWLRRRARTHGEAGAAYAAASLAFFTLAPVVAHWRLDAFSSLGGDLAGLRSLRPWAELLLAVGLLLLALAGLCQAAARLRTTRLGAGLALCALALGFAWAPPGESSEGSPAASGKPNLLLLVWDTTRAQSLSLYGYDRKTTPNLERLAAESIVFEEARSPSRYTLTSHLSMLTGVYPSDHGARMTRQRVSPGRTPSVAATLRAHGYRTAAFVGTGVLSAPTGVGFGFERYDDQVDPPVCDTRAWALVHDLQSLAARLGPPFSRNGQPHWIQDFFRPAEQVLARAAAWIDNGDPRPWFVMVNLYDVHWPYRPDPQRQREWVEPYDGPIDGFHERSDRYPRGHRMTPRDDQHLLQLYDAEMAALDQQVDRFLGGLDLERGDTAVLMCSDHGEAFGEGGEYEHGDILEPQVRIPFVLRLPGATSGRRVPAVVSGVDVAPTLLSIAGLEIPPRYTGVDALELADAPPGEPRRILVEDRDQMDIDDVRLALYEGPWKLVRRGLGQRQRFELFDLRSDPLGLKDVSAAEPELLERLKLELEVFRARWNADDVKDQQGTGFPNQDALQGLGYTGQ